MQSSPTDFSSASTGGARALSKTYFADPQEKIVAVLMKQTQQLSGDNSEAAFIRMIYQTLDD